MMTRKDYVALVGALARAARRATSDAGREGADLALEEITSVLAADNPRFDRERFMDAYRKGVES